MGGESSEKLITKVKLRQNRLSPVKGETSARCELELVIERKNGETQTVPVLCRLDSDSDVRTYKARGVLREFAGKFLDG